METEHQPTMAIVRVWEPKNTPQDSRAWEFFAKDALHEKPWAAYTREPQTKCDERPREFLFLLALPDEFPSLCRLVTLATDQTLEFHVQLLADTTLDYSSEPPKET